MSKFFNSGKLAKIIEKMRRSWNLAGTNSAELLEISNWFLTESKWQRGLSLLRIGQRGLQISKLKKKRPLFYQFFHIITEFHSSFYRSFADLKNSHHKIWAGSKGAGNILLSFLGCIGFIINGSGLKPERHVISTIYSPNYGWWNSNLFSGPLIF